MADAVVGGEIVVAGAGKLQALNQYGRAFRLRGGTAPNPVEVRWSSVGDVSVDLELLIRVAETDPGTDPAGLSVLNPRVYPAIRWQVWSHGHGQLTLDYPPPVNGNLILTSKQRQPQWPVPARGVGVRLNARHLRVLLTNLQTSTNPLIEVSIEPLLAGSSQWRPFPAHDLGIRNTAGMRAYFPPLATEWRLQDVYEDLTRFGVDPGTPIELYEWSNAQAANVLQTIPAYMAFDWAPIPLGAHSWAPSINAVEQLFLSALYR